MQFKDYKCLIAHILPQIDVQNAEDCIDFFNKVTEGLSNLPTATNDFETLDRFSAKVTTESQLVNWKELGHSVWEE